MPVRVQTEDFDAGAEIARLRAAVDQRMARDDTPLGAEVAFFPPVTGG